MGFFEELIISGFISQIISECFDITKEKIKEAVQNRKIKHQSFETQIYNVTVDALNKFTHGEYKREQDQIFDTAEVLLKLFKDGEENQLDAITFCLNRISVDVIDDIYIELKEKIYDVICEDEYAELFRKLVLLQQDKKNSYDIKQFERLHQKLDEGNNQILNELERQRNRNDFEIQSIKFYNKRKQDYITNWNSRLFLHQDNSKPITLKNSFIIPDYELIKAILIIRYSKNKSLDKIINMFVEHKKSSTMLISGVPGIGKTSLISWIANEYKEDNRFLFLRFRDWDSKSLKNGLLEAICEIFNCKKDDLDYKILIIDGLDEIKALNEREHILGVFFNDIKDLKHFKCIITSRQNYISTEYFQNALTLLPFNLKQINKFYRIITGNDLAEENIDNGNLGVLGIPVILYLAIMSNIDITQSATKPELYSRIFAMNGGIFDRFNDGDSEYDEGAHILRNIENIRIYLEFLRMIAFEMFEKNSLFLPQNKYQIPKLDYQGEKTSVLEFPIKYLFEDIDINIEFIHNSIYEYFVAEYIFNLIKDNIYQTKEKLAYILGELLKTQKLNEEILDFLTYKIKDSVLNYQLDKLIIAFNIMLENGMLYYTQNCYKNPIQLEINILVNMLEIIHLCENNYINDGYFEFDFELFCKYLRCDIQGLNLSKLNMKGINLQKVYAKQIGTSRIFIRRINLVQANLKESKLRGVDLSCADLVKANLVQANLRAANLYMVDLRDADLEGADLRGANLEGVNLQSANLKNTIIDEKQLKYLEKDYDLWCVRIYIKELDDIISYEDYKKIR